MSIDIQKLHVVKKGHLQVTFFPNCPNPDYLPKPVEAYIRAGQFWYNHHTSMVWKIKLVRGVDAVSLVSVVNDLVHEPEVLRKTVSISKFLQEYSKIIEAKVGNIKNKKAVNLCSDNLLESIL